MATTGPQEPRKPRPSPGAWPRLCVSIISILSALAAAPHARADQGREVQVIRRIEAGFLFNFVRFATWPEARMQAGAPIVIGIAGDPAAEEIISRELAGRSYMGHAIVVRAIAADSPLEEVHMLFIPRKSSVATAPLLKRAQGRPVLTIGEADDFNLLGGMIRLFVRDDTMHFALNLKAARDAGIALNSQLAAMAEPDSQ